MHRAHGADSDRKGRPDAQKDDESTAISPGLEKNTEPSPGESPLDRLFLVTDNFYLPQTAGKDRGAVKVRS